MEESHKGTTDQVTRSKIGIVALIKIFFKKGGPIWISIFLSHSTPHVLIKTVHSCNLGHLEAESTS